MKISGVYKITNTITGDFYIGSSKDIKQCWYKHKCYSKWKENPNSDLYKDMAKYCLDNFLFEVLEETDKLKEREQYYIEQLKPTYNNYRAKGQDTERYRKHNIQITKEYYQSEKGKETQKRYQQSEKGKDASRRANKKYLNQLCSYNGEVLKFGALCSRFNRSGIEHPAIEAKKYLI